MTTYSRQLFAGHLSVAAMAFKADNAAVYVVRDIELWNAGSGTPDIAVNLLDASGSYLAGLITAKSVPVNGTAQWEGRVVMVSGQELFVAATLYPVGCVISGYALSP